MGTGLAADNAVVFPGMGPSRFEDVARFMVINPFARRLTAEADEVLGYSLLDRCRESEGDYSEPAQLAFFVNCLALAQWAEQAHGMAPAVCAGPSFGAKAAAVYSGALSFADGVRMTAAYARCLDEYFAEEFQDVVTHSFTRTPADRLAEILAELSDEGEWHEISCYVDEDFHMLSLREHKVDWLKERLGRTGGFSLYTMRPPLHSTEFGALRNKAEDEVFGGLEFTDPRIPVVADQDGSLLYSGDAVRGMLLDGFVRPVRWPEVTAALKRFGVSRVYVSGPDSLFGRVKCTTTQFEVVPLNPRLALQPARRSRAV
jgi:[acyl-carrier-protein] S-malonyltransferase